MDENANERTGRPVTSYRQLEYPNKPIRLRVPVKDPRDAVSPALLHRHSSPEASSSATKLPQSVKFETSTMPIISRSALLHHLRPESASQLSVQTIETDLYEVEEGDEEGDSIDTDIKQIGYYLVNNDLDDHDGPSNDNRPSNHTPSVRDDCIHEQSPSLTPSAVEPEQSISGPYNPEAPISETQTQSESEYMNVNLVPDVSASDTESSTEDRTWIERLGILILARPTARGMRSGSEDSSAINRPRGLFDGVIKLVPTPLRHVYLWTSLFFLACIASLLYRSDVAHKASVILRGEQGHGTYEFLPDPPPPSHHEQYLLWSSLQAERRRRLPINRYRKQLVDAGVQVDVNRRTSDS